MKIGIDASRAFLKERTGIEEYAYQVIAHLRSEIACEHDVVLYIRKGQAQRMCDLKFSLPHNWSVLEVRTPRYWTQIGLSLELRNAPVDVLFIPAHTIPFIHPKNSIVTIHGLEYEFCPEAYSWWERLYMRYSIRASCVWASKIIAVSHNTKKDLMELYRVPEEKIVVVYEGFDQETLLKYKLQGSHRKNEISPLAWRPYIFFIGRLEERKNVVRIIEAFDMLKKVYHIKHNLVLAGKPGYGHSSVEHAIKKSEYRENIIEMGYVSEQEKVVLLKHADIFAFPTLYEGFGLPLLEAQALGVPVVTSTNSSLPEIAGQGAVLVDPQNADDIMRGMYQLISNNLLKDDMIRAGSENIKKYSWQKCAREIARSFGLWDVE